MNTRDSRHGDSSLEHIVPYGKHFLDQSDIDAVVEVLKSSYLTQGPRIDEFERKIAAYVGARYAVAVANGTAALHLACLAADVGRGDRIITSANTFVATANCARYVGAEPVFSDIDPDTLNLDPVALAAECRRIKKLKAIIPVHFAGLPCDMAAIRDVARKHGATVIEDACHALGATYQDGDRVGSCRHSDMTVFSFHPVKIIAAGEGGMITTNSEALYRRLLRLRSHGINKLDDAFVNRGQAFDKDGANPWYYEMQELGFNYRMTDIQAALAMSQFAKIDKFLARRREIAAAYDDAFETHSAIMPAQKAGRAYSAHHLYVILADFGKVGRSRRDVMLKLRESGIYCQVHYIPVYMQPYYATRVRRKRDFPATRRYYDRALSIPMYYSLSRAEQEFVIREITGALKQRDY